MAKKKTLYKADFSNSKQRAAEYAEAYRQKRQENKSFVEPLANNKDYRTQQAKKFADLSGANATTNKSKTGRETITPESWAGGTISAKKNGPTTTAKADNAKRTYTAKTTTGTNGPKERVDFSKSRQRATNFADNFREQKRNGTLPGRTTSIYDVARQAVDDARKERDYRAKAADVLGLTGRPITGKTLQKEIDSAYRQSMRQRGNPALNGISRDIARPRAARTNEIRNMALERMQESQREKAEQERRRQQGRIENRKDGYAQVSQTAEPLERKGQRLLDSLAGRKTYAELAGSRNLNDRKDGPVVVDKRKPNLNGYVPEDNTYEEILQDPDYNLYKLKGKTSFYDPDYQAGIDRMFGASPVDYMTQEQKDTYNYIYGKYGRDAVKEYEKSILPELNRMMQEDITQRSYEEARANPLKGLANDLTNAMWAPRGAFESAVNVITGNPIDTNSRAFIGTNAQAAAHQGLVDSAKDTFGDNYMTNVLAEGGLGMAENASRYWMGPAGLTFMGMQAASSGIKEAKDRGATDEQAMAVGITNGIVEYLTEQVSLGNLENVTKYTENPIKSAKDFARAVALNFGVEASEEMASEILDTAADYMIMQDNSNLMRNYRGYLEQGMTEEQAKQAVVGDFIRDVANAGIVGGITGAGMSGIAGTYNLAMNKANENAINRFITQDYARRGMMPTETASQMLENIAKEAEQEQKGPSISDINEWASSEREDVSNPVYDAYREAGENLADSFEGDEGKKAFLDIPLADRTKAYRAFAAYYNLGYRGTEISPEMQEQASKVLTLQQMSDAMNAGAKDQQVNYPMQQVKAVEDAAKKVEIPETKEGTIYYDKKRYQNWTSQQKLRVNYAGALISKVFGLDVEFFESVVGDDGKFYDAESYNDPNRENELARNGAFYVSPRTGRPTIMLDINAGMNKASDWTGDISDIKTLFPIISHEMTHYMEQYAPEHYKALSDTITNALIKNSSYTKGLTLNQMIQSQRIRMETRDNKTYTNDDALREIVARACEDMLSGNEDAVEAFQSMNKDTQRYVWNHVKKIFDNIRDFFRQMLTEYRSGSAEAQAIRQNMEEFEKIRAKWQEALGFATSEGRNVEFKSAVNAETETGTPDSFVNGVSKDGVTTGGKSGAQFSERTYQNGGREYLKMWLETQSDLSEEDRKDVVFQIDSVYNIMQKVKEEGGLEGYTAWSNVEERDGVLTVVVPNGEYPLNIDFSTVCKKRKALDHILNVMIQNEQLSAADLAGKDIVRLQQIIKSEGLEIACALCFVDAKRYRIGEWAERITAGKDTGDSHQYGFNELLDSLIPEGSKLKIDEHNFTERDIKQPKGKLLKNAPDDQLDFTLVDRLIKNSNKSSWNYKAAKTIRENPDVRSYLNPAELLSSIGFDPIKVQSPAIFNLINQSGGASKPKLSFSEVPYLNDILMNQQMTPEQAYKVGGVRIQSFSDFMANMVFDYVQMVGELQAKKLPAHAYTKEASFVAIFGKTGIKINMSLVPKATKMTQEEIRKYITQFDTKKKRQQAYNELKKRAGLDENGNYLWEDETFPYEVAMHFQADPEYAKNCGTIAVGVSDAHIRKLLADPTIQMVIPYHTSGINKTIAKMRGIDLYTDYTKQQTTKNRATGKSITASQNTFDFYKVLQETGDPKKTADEYLKWCDENNFIPKFSKFTKGEGSENYYKLLIDFRVYDENGDYAQQQAVQAIYPSDDLMKEYILNGYTYTAEDGTVYQNGGLRAAQETSDKLAAKTEEIIRRYNEGETGKEVKVQNSSRDSAWDRSPAEVDAEYLKAVKASEKALQKYRLSGKELFKSAAEKAKNKVHELVKDYAAAAGYTAELYHGSRKFGFTEFDLDKMDDKISIFTTSSRDLAETYSGETKRNRISDRLPANILEASPEQVEEELKKINPNYRRVSKTTADSFLQFNRKRASEITEGIFDYLESGDETVENADGYAIALAERLGASVSRLAHAKDFFELVRANKYLNDDYYALEREDPMLASQVMGTSKRAELMYDIYPSLSILLDDEKSLYAIGTDEDISAATSWITDSYARKLIQEEGGAGIYHLYGKEDNLLTIDAEGSNWNEIPVEKVPAARIYTPAETGLFDSNHVTKEEARTVAQQILENKYGKDDTLDEEVYGETEDSMPRIVFKSHNTGDTILAILNTTWGNKLTTREVAKYAKDEGYDGVKIKNLNDNGPVKRYNKAEDVYIYFDPSQLKSADDVTYDDDGNVIPLNERFNPKKTDLRYSSREETIEIGPGDDKTSYKTDELTKQYFDEGKSRSAEIVLASTKSEILEVAKNFYSKYQSGTANENNYYINTIAEFKETSRPRRKPDYVSRTRDGRVSSEYWYTDNGVIRGSKHWGAGVASCDWFLEGMGTEMDTYKLYGKAKWEDFVQKPEIVTNEGEATISTFENTIGGKKGRLGFMTPIVRDFNDNEKIQYASRDDDLAASIWDEVVAEREDKEGRDSVFFMDEDDPTKFTYQQQEYMEALSKSSETAQAMNAALHQVIGEGKKVDVDKFAKEQARKLRLNFGSKADKTELQDAIKSLCGLMNDAIQKDANRIAIAASNIGSEVMHNIMVDDDSMSQMYPTLKKELLSYKMKPSEKAKKDMAYAYDTYQSFRRRAFNKLTLVGDDADRFIRVDSAYMELSEKYPELFPADVENESDQLLLMMEVAQELNGKTIPMVEAFGTPEDEIDATAYMIGQDILSDYYKAAGQPAFGGVLDSVRRDLIKSNKEEIREAVKKKNEKIQKQAEQIRELKAKLEEKNLDAKEAAKYQKDLDHLEKLNALARQQERYEGKLGKLRGKLDENKQAAREAKRYQAALLRMQMRFDKRLSKIKVKQLDREARTRLLNAANRLAKMKGGPEFEARREALIGDLDIIAKGLRSDTKKALEDLKTKAEKLAAEDQDYALVGYPKDKAVFERLSKRHVNEMTGTEVARLTEAILELENSEYISKRMLRRDEQIRVFTAANRIMTAMRNAKGINGRNAIGSTFGRYALNMLNPVRALARLDGYMENGELTRLGKELNDGQTKMNEFMMRTSKKFNSFLEKHQNLADTWYKSDIDTGLKDKDGNPVMINKGMRISLYLHSRNAHNMNHIIRSGLEIPDAKLYQAGKYEEAYRYNTSVKLKVADVNRILGGMTEDEKAFANLAYEFFNKDTKDAINETSLELNGVYKAVVDNYYPIKADKNFTKGDVTGLVQDATIEGWNNLKERRTDAATLILLEDAAAVIQRQAENTAKYYGLAIPVRNFNKVLKWAEPNINGSETKKSVRSTIDATWGSAGLSYIDTMLRDIQTGARADEGPGAKIFSSLKSTYAGTVLNWNIGVSIKQAASAPFAAVVLDAKSVAKAFSPTTIFKKADLDYMDSITPWSYMRRQGMSGTEMGEVYKPQNMIQKSGPVKWLKKNTNFIQAVDVWTTNRLFFATEYYVQDHFPDLTYRGEAYNRKVAEVYNDMLQRTQPSYDVMQRNAFLRSDSPFTKVFGMFKTQTFNMGGEVIDSWGRLTAYEKMHKNKQVTDAQLKKVKKQFGKTVGATIASQLMLTALGVLAKAVYHNMKNYRDDKGEVTAESIIGRALYEFATSFSGLFMLGTEAQSLGLALAGREKWYDLEYPGLSTVNDFLTNANNTTEAFRAAMESGWDADKADDFRKKCMELAMSGMIMGRIPADNIYKFANGIYLHVQDIKDGKFGSFEAGEGLFGLRNSSVTKDQYAQRAAAAYAAGDTEAGDEAAEKTTKKKLQKAMYGVDEDASKAMVDYVAAGGSKEEFTRGKDLAKEIEEKDIKGDDVYAYVVASKDFTNEEKVAWFKTSTQRTGSKKYTAWKDAGYGDWDFIKYRSDLSKFSGDGKQEKIVNYIKKQTTDTKKRKALWMLAGYKESSYDKNMN